MFVQNAREQNNSLAFSVNARLFVCLVSFRRRSAHAEADAEPLMSDVCRCVANVCESSVDVLAIACAYM